MFDKTKINGLVDQLFKYHRAELIVDGESIWVEFSDDLKKLIITTSVFYGGGFIPQSVRGALNARTFIPEAEIHAFLTLNEETSQVLLNFSKELDEGFGPFESWIEEFVWLSMEWRFILERYGREDLVFVYVKK